MPQIKVTIVDVDNSEVRLEVFDPLDMSIPRTHMMILKQGETITFPLADHQAVAFVALTPVSK